VASEKPLFSQGLFLYILIRLVYISGRDEFMITNQTNVHKKINRIMQILLEVKKSSDETAKRVAELLGESRRH
jgi:hypothetical protein